MKIVNPSGSRVVARYVGKSARIISEDQFGTSPTSLFKPYKVFHVETTDTNGHITQITLFEDELEDD